MKAKFTTNINKELLDKTKIKAIQEGKNVNEIIENLLQQYLKGEIEMTNYTKIYKDENNSLVLSYAGIDKSECENITHEEFIEIVENSNAWNGIDAEIYESALEDVGLDYSQYEDPDLMWEDYLEAVRG